MKHPLTYIVFVALAFGACSAAGSAPEASGLTLSTANVAVGSPVAVAATVHFRDPDADLFEAETVLSGATIEEVRSTVRVSGTEGIVEGSINVQLMVVAPEAGTYELALRLRDAEGNDSEWVRASFEAQ